MNRPSAEALIKLPNWTDGNPLILSSPFIDICADGAGSHAPVAIMLQQPRPFGQPPQGGGWNCWVNPTPRPDGGCRGYAAGELAAAQDLAGGYRLQAPAIGVQPAGVVELGDRAGL